MAAQRGFTLLEVTVVIAILGLVAGIIATRGPLRSERFELASSARILASTLRLARSQAIVSDRIVAVVARGDAFAIEGGPVSHLPRGEVLSERRILFTPSGQSSGTTFVVAGRTGRILVSVNWLTGQVRVSAYQPSEA